MSACFPPPGIIINEFMTNTMKYAFTDRNNGLIGISLSRRAGMVHIINSDDGLGLPSTSSFDNSTGFELQGSVSVEGPPGTTSVLSFPG